MNTEKEGIIMAGEHTKKYSINLVAVESDYSYCEEMQIIRNGEIIRRQEDGGEPEDQSFGRDWSWVEEALMEAYEFGLEDGKKISEIEFNAYDEIGILSID